MNTGAFAHARADPRPRMLWCKWADIAHFYISMGTLTAVILAMAGAVPYHLVPGICAAFQILAPKIRAGVRDCWKFHRARHQSMSEPLQPSHHLCSSKLPAQMLLRLPTNGKNAVMSISSPFRKEHCMLDATISSHDTCHQL